MVEHSSTPVDSASASNLIEFTFQALYRHLSQQDPIDPAILLKSINLRLSKLKEPAAPIPGPSQTSRATLESGAVTLDDGVRLRVRDTDKEFAYLLSEKLHLDEVEAFVLFRSFLYHEGSERDLKSDDEGVDEMDQTSADEESPLLSAIIDFYLEERLFLLRIYEPLFRAHGDESHPYHDVAEEALSSLVPDPPTFISSLITELVDRTQRELPVPASKSPRQATRWAKQTLKEELCLLEGIFWATYDINTPGTVVVQFYSAMYSTSLGRSSKHKSLLLDPDSTQLFSDLHSLFILTGIEILNLESLVNKEETLDLELVTINRHGYLASPQYVEEIHQLLLATPSEPSYAPILLAWAAVLRRITDAAGNDEYPKEYARFLNTICPSPSDHTTFHPSAPLPDPAWQTFVEAALSQNMRLLETLITLLEMPVLSSDAAIRVSSSITSPGDLFFRSTLKMLVLCLTELMRLEFLAELPTFTTLWTSLFSNGPTPIVSVLTSEFWQRDFRRVSSSRRSLLEITRDRFPIQVLPFIRVMKSLSGMGSSDLSNLEGFVKERLHDVNNDRLGSAAMVFEYVHDLETYCQVIPAHELAIRSLYEQRIDSNGIPIYYNLQPFKLPGGSTLATRTVGRTLTQTASGGSIVIMWQHKHNGWKFLFAVLREYGRLRRDKAGGKAKLDDLVDVFNAIPSFKSKIQRISMEEIGMEEDIEDRELIAQILDLFRSVFHNNPTVRTALIDSLTDDRTLPSTSVAEPDLIQTCLFILNDALSTGSSGTPSPARLVTNVLGVLAALLPNVSSIWNFLRSWPLLFGDSRQKGSMPALLAAERAVGRYDMTISLLDFVRGLVDEACRITLRPPDQRPAASATTSVLLQALTFIHNDVWVEHMGWKYASVADRFDIGRRITSIYAEILARAPPTAAYSDTDGSSLSVLSLFVLDNFLFRPSAASINPLVQSIGTGYQVLDVLYHARRWIDAQRLVQLLHAEFHLIRLLLLRKRNTPTDGKPSLLEQGLFSGGTSGVLSLNRRSSRTNPIDTFASLITHRNEFDLQMESVKLFSALCHSVVGWQPSAPSLLGHIANPEELASYIIWTIQQQQEDDSLKRSLWKFITVVADTQPSLGMLFVTGKLQVLDQMELEKEGNQNQGKGKQRDEEWPEKESALDVARDVITNWSSYWEDDPSILSSALGFLDVIWQHSTQYKRSLAPLRSDQSFWATIAGIVTKSLGPAPESIAADFMTSTLQETPERFEDISAHAYRTVAKAHAIHIFSLDMAIPPSPADKSKSSKSFEGVQRIFESEIHLQKMLEEGISSSFNPDLQEEVHQYLKLHFPYLPLESMRSRDLPFEREFGDSYLFPVDIVKEQLSDCGFSTMESRSREDAAFRRITSLNLNWSLTDAQIALTKAWTRLLQDSSSFLRGKPTLLKNLANSAVFVARAISEETRPGEIMAAIHRERLSVLQELLEIVGSSSVETTSLEPLSSHVQAIVVSETFPPLDSLRGLQSVRFHHNVFQILYYCSRMVTTVLQAPATSPTRYPRSILMVSASGFLAFAIDAMRVAFDSARQALDENLDRDLELIVVIFEQCTRLTIHPSPSAWLSRCQDRDLIRTSLDLLVRVDISGAMYPDIVRHRLAPLYTPHILQFHVALSSIPAAAERLAHEGVILAYSRNECTPSLEVGSVDPGQTAHSSWCRMVEVATGIVAALGDTGGHFVSSEIVGFIQLYGAQLSRVLSWNASGPLSLALFEELDAAVGLFHAIAVTAVSPEPDHMTSEILRGYSEKALVLLQQLNHALSHPNSMLTLVETMTSDERKFLESQLQTSLPVTESLQLLDGSKHPLVASITQKMIGFASTILCTLVIISRADEIISQAEVVGKVNPPLLPARANITINEPASVGTLIDIGNWSSAAIQHLREKELRAVIPQGIALAPFHSKTTVDLSRRAMEALMVYTTAQLYLWLRAQSADDGLPSALQDDHDQRGRRKSIANVQDRVRGEVQDLAMDLNMLAGKSRELFGKMAEADGGSAVVLVHVLIGFASARLIRTDSYR